jgi:hypothetical protein
MRATKKNAVGQAPARRAAATPAGRSCFDVLRESISDPDVLHAAQDAERDSDAAAATRTRPASA